MKVSLATTSTTVLAFINTAVVIACAGHDHNNNQKRHAHALGARQGPKPYPTGPGYDFPAFADIKPVNDDQPTEPLVPLPTPPVVGQVAFPGAPPLPAVNINPADWPPLGQIPPTNSPQVQKWLKELEGHDIPTWGRNINGSCGADPTALAQAGPDARCWWTCGGCTRKTDITTCNDKMDWGLTYDDGPAVFTPKLLTWLDSQALKATFFLIGGNVISRPEMVQAEHLAGHQLSVHTWSHPVLTNLTNEEIVAELGWTREAIKVVTGLTPLTMRPPQGDIDDRVRAISMAMGLVPVMWTRLSDQGDLEFDSNDWRVHAGEVTATEAQANLNKAIDLAPNLNTGVIVLQHDIHQETVDLAIGYTQPQNIAKGFKMQPVVTCLKQPIGNSYLETTSNTTTTPTSGSGTTAGTGKSTSTVTSTGKATGTGTATPTGAASSFYPPSSVGALVAAALGGVLAIFS